MEIITQIRLPTSRKNNVKKIAEKKKVEKIKPIIQNIHKIILTEYPRMISIYAYLQSEYRAVFQNRNDSLSDYFYLCLEDLKDQHIDYLGEYPEKYKLPYDTEGFNFKHASYYLQCTNSNNSIIDISQCIGKKVSIKLRVKPYDFISKETGGRIVGLTIQASKIILM